MGESVEMMEKINGTKNTRVINERELIDLR